MDKRRGQADSDQNRFRITFTEVLIVVESGGSGGGGGGGESNSRNFRKSAPTLLVTRQPEALWSN